MANTIQIKRSSVAGKQPNVGDLQVGELAVNLADGILYSKNTAGNIIVVGSSTTSNVLEGDNLYFTTSRANTAIDDRVTLDFVDSLGAVITDDLTTDNVIEATNLYYTNSRVLSHLAVSSVVTGSLEVQGELTVSGNVTSITATELAISDNMIYMNQGIAATITNIVGDGSNVTFTANNNYSAGWDVSVYGVNPSSFNGLYSIIEATSTYFVVADTNTDTYVSGGQARGKANANPDIGFAAGYNDGKYHHTGLFRDATDGVWKFFQNYDPEPDESIFIDTSNASFQLANVQANYFFGNVSLEYNTTSDLAEGTNLYYTNARVESYVSTLGYASTDDLTTANVLEVTNLYYTNARVESYVSTLGYASTDDLTTANVLEVTNLYFTVDRANSAINDRVTKAFVDNLNVDAGTLDGIDSTAFALVTDLTTDNVIEATNLYYTNSRVVSAFTAGQGIILESNGQIVANVVSSGGASVTVANVAPGSASSGDLYWDEELGRLFIYYEDTDSSQWVEASPTLTPEVPTASGISTGKAIAMAIVFG